MERPATSAKCRRPGQLHNSGCTGARHRMAPLEPRPVGAVRRHGPAAGDDSSKDTETMFTFGLLPPRLTEPEIGRSVIHHVA